MNRAKCCLLPLMIRTQNLRWLAGLPLELPSSHLLLSGLIHEKVREQTCLSSPVYVLLKYVSCHGFSEVPQVQVLVCWGEHCLNSKSPFRSDLFCNLNSIFLDNWIPFMVLLNYANCCYFVYANDPLENIELWMWWPSCCRVRSQVLAESLMGSEAAVSYPGLIPLKGRNSHWDQDVVMTICKPQQEGGGCYVRGEILRHDLLPAAPQEDQPKV